MGHGKCSRHLKTQTTIAHHCYPQVVTKWGHDSCGFHRRSAFSSLQVGLKLGKSGSWWRYLLESIDTLQKNPVRSQSGKASREISLSFCWFWTSEPRVAESGKLSEDVFCQMMRSYCKASVIAFAISCDSRFPKVSNFFGFPAVYGEDSTSSPSWSKLKVKNHIRCQFFQIHANAQKKRGRLWRTRSWRRSRRCLATTQWGSLRRMRPARRWYFQCRASIVPSTTVRTHYIHIDMDDINYIYIYIHIVCIYIYINTHTHIYIYTYTHIDCIHNHMKLNV